MVSGSIRKKNFEKYTKCVELRKRGLSYGEITKEVEVAKSTLQNWLTLSGLTLTPEHLLIQAQKRVKNSHNFGILASQQIRAERKASDIETFVGNCKEYFLDPLFIAGVMSYEAEGSKDGTFKFSNSDYRLVSLFIKFAEKYLQESKKINMTFRLFIHESRRENLETILLFWSEKLNVPKAEIKVTWKKNLIKKRRQNSEYVGQMAVCVINQHFLCSKISKLSAIIMHDYCGVG